MILVFLFVKEGRPVISFWVDEILSMVLVRYNINTSGHCLMNGSTYRAMFEINIFLVLSSQDLGGSLAVGILLMFNLNILPFFTL